MKDRFDHWRVTAKAHPWTVVGITVALITGLALRIYCATSDLGTLDSDMAVLGLMARDMQHGHFTAFHWGQQYGGSQEAMLAALLGLPFGVSTGTLHLTTILLSALTAGAVGWLGRELFDRRAGITAGLLMWLWPAFAIWWSVKIGSNYWFSLAAAVSFAALLVRMKRTSNSTRRNLFLVGLLAGLAWWGNPQTAYVLGPALVLHARCLWRARYLMWATLMGFAAGASPWLYAVSRDGLSPTGSEPSPPVADAVTSIFSNWLPVLLGLRPPFEVTAWTAWSASVIAVVLLTAMIAVIVRQPVPARLPTVGALLFLAGFTLSPFVRYTDSPRYALWVVPWLVLLVAIALTRLPRTAVPMALGGAAVLSAFGVHSLNQPLAATHYAPDVLAPTSTEGPSQLMRANGVTHAYADYWLAYRTTFTEDDVELSPTYSVRNGHLNARVRSSEPAYVFLTQSDTLQQFLGYCQESAITCSVASDGPYTLVKPDRLITPSDASERVQWLRDMRATGV